ncbi:FAD-dependent monooxygenase, partial [Nitratireductor sp. GCM10026969]|uniref:FAD-dependent monooxygenase n=1 Tax=Nitratireductor sp. GCM10026969 TaxID=3252645 RepID=UPI003619BDF6
FNIPNAALNRALAERARAEPGIRWHECMVEHWQPAADSVTARLADATTVRAVLAVAADGRKSPAREAAGIATRTRPLPQSALVLNFGHTRHHGFTSTEFHTEHGPCTQVPLPGGFRSSLVWVMQPANAETLKTLDETALSERLERQLQSILGRVAVEPGCQVYPLSTALPARFAARRIALVGEAAHVFPPITAQGLNLGLRDVAELARIVHAHGQDPGAPAALERYDARRRPDITARSRVVNLFNASLLTSLLPAQLARSAGLGLLDSMPLLRGFFMREGMRPGSGLAALLPPFARRS